MWYTDGVRNCGAQAVTTIDAERRAPGLRFLASGDCGLTVQLGETMDPGIAERVAALDAAIAAAGIAGIGETVPTYRSILVVFDPVVVSRAALTRAIAELWPPPPGETRRRRRWRIPVAYGGEEGEDLAALAAGHRLSQEEVVALHLAPAYRVAMIGFSPGFAYLLGLDPRIATDRRTDPRPATPPGSVSIGGVQTGIGPPLTLPSGWQLIGRTPVRSYDPARPAPFLFDAGDEIRFARVDAAEYHRLSDRAAAGELIAVDEAA